jgi:hypothetical protein
VRQRACGKLGFQRRELEIDCRGSTIYRGITPRRAQQGYKVGSISNRSSNFASVVIRRRFYEQHGVGKTLLGGFGEDSWLETMMVMGHVGLFMGHVHGKRSWPNRPLRK